MAGVYVYIPIWSTTWLLSLHHDIEHTPDDDDTPRASDLIFAVLANLVDSSLQT
jgi:hypothetical protein